MLRRSARSAGIAPQGNEDADHGVEPGNEVEARGHVGRRVGRQASAREGAATEEERKEPSEFDEDEESADGEENVRDGGGTLTEVRFGCDDCAIKESTMQGIRCRLRDVRQALIQARHELANVRAQQSSGGGAVATRALNK